MSKFIDRVNAARAMAGQPPIDLPIVSEMESQMAWPFLGGLAERGQRITQAVLALYGWDLPDDPHGYAADYDRKIQELAKLLHIELPPSPNII